MSNQLLSSKVTVEEEEPKLRSVPNLPTAIVGCVGITERGPLGLATLVTSFDEYVATFGGHVANTDMAAVVEAFFLNGGTQMYVVRTVHYTTISTASSKTSAAATIVLLDRAGSPISTLRVDGKYDGTYANNLRIKILAPTNGVADNFDFQVTDVNGVVLESFPNLSMVDTAARWAPAVINATPVKGGSKLIQVTDTASVTAAPGDLPALGTFAPISGSDGLASLADNDFIGDAAAKNGIRALDLVDNLTILIVPGRATSAVHNAMVTYADITRAKAVFTILDPPAATSATGIITYKNTTAALGEISECAAIYWPRVKISNPKKSVYGSADQVTVPPSGHIAGVFSRVDNARSGGVYDPPAGPDVGVLFGVLDFETNETLDEAKRDLVFPERINPLTTYKGGPRFIDGARCLKSTGNWPTVAQRRGASNIEQTVKVALQVYRHKNNTATLRAGIFRTIFAYLVGQMNFGAFVTKVPSTAFFVDVGDALNPPTAPNVITLRVGLATAQPAEFIVTKFSQDTRAAEAAASATS